MYTRGRDVFQHSHSNHKQELCHVQTIAWIRQNDNRTHS